MSKKMTISTSVEVYSSVEELSPIDQELLTVATRALGDSYAPYSKFQVGAAVLLDNGKILPGSNQENASYPLCLCAERVALAAAAALYPKESIMAIAVTAKNPSAPLRIPVSPCGACRQVMCEVEQKHEQRFRVILSGESGDIYRLQSAAELLPLSFDARFLIAE